MKTRFALSLTLFLLLLFLGSASMLVAQETMPPGFDNPANNPTSQKWLPEPFGEPPMPGEPWPEPEPLPPSEIPPMIWDNPYGEPHVGFGEGWEKEWMNPPGSEPQDPVEPIPTWHYDGIEPGKLIITIPNSLEQNPLKRVWFSIIADKAPSDAARPIGVGTGYNPPPANTPSVTWDATAWQSVQLGGGTADGGVWYRYEGMANIRPNPQWETLEFDIVHCTNIAEINVRSVCVPAPEPSSLVLVALGLVGLCCPAAGRRHHV